jgi:hypothetical protein
MLSSRIEAAGDEAGLLSIRFPVGFYFIGTHEILSQSSQNPDGSVGKGTWTIVNFRSVACNMPETCTTNMTLQLSGGTTWYWGQNIKLELGILQTDLVSVESQPIVVSLSSGSGKLAEILDGKKFSLSSAAYVKISLGGHDFEVTCFVQV